MPRSEWEVIIDDNGVHYSITARQGENLLDVIHKTKASVHSPCGGKGTCRKCLVEIEGVGQVLSCQVKVGDELDQHQSGIISVILPKKAKARILTDWQLPEYTFKPIVEQKRITMDPPGLNDQFPDDIRLYRTSGKVTPFQRLAELPKIFRDSNFDVMIYSRTDTNQVVDVVNAAHPSHFYGVAFDIGTTTLAAALYDLAHHRLINTASRLNSQKRHGADVISRIEFASSSKKNLHAMQLLILKDIMEILYEMLDDCTDVKIICFSGNTTMMHLLSGINPAAIAVAPFIPVTLSSHRIGFSELFPDFRKIDHFNPLCILLPSVAGYVGADITAGIMTCQMDESDKTILLIDVGTNGEIALSVSGRIIACSTAAGPAFEGANITCGTGGIAGAIDKVYIDQESIRYTTIDHEAPLGICGSGIVSAIATLLNLGLIDETGRFDDDTVSLAAELANDFAMVNNEKVYVLAYDDMHQPVVYLTQKDVREVQNAKAAVCAGIRLLLLKEQLKEADIDTVYISGGFGNYLNVDDAFTIGLIPPGLRGKTLMKGNTSITGAILCLLDNTQIERAEKVRQITAYFELSSEKEFTELYIDEMFFNQ